MVSRAPCRMTLRKLSSVLVVAVVAVAFVVVCAAMCGAHTANDDNQHSPQRILPLTQRTALKRTALKRIIFKRIIVKKVSSEFNSKEIILLEPSGKRRDILFTFYIVYSIARDWTSTASNLPNSRGLSLMLAHCQNIFRMTFGIALAMIYCSCFVVVCEVLYV
jgi:hypothetical protein